MPYIHFTEEQKLRACEVDLVEFLRHQEIGRASCRERV